MSVTIWLGNWFSNFQLQYYAASGNRSLFIPTSALSDSTNDNGKSLVRFSSVHSLSPVQLFVTPWTAAHQASLSIINSRCLLKLMFIELAMPSNHLILRCPLFLLPSIFHIIRVFSNESVLCHQVAKILELQHQSFQ